MPGNQVSVQVDSLFQPRVCFYRSEFLAGLVTANPSSEALRDLEPRYSI